MRVLTVIGTRPEAIKMAPVIAELARQAGVVSRVLATGQHRHMLDQVLAIFRIAPDYDLDVMRPDQSPTDVLARIASGIQPVLRQFAPDWVLVQGDTTTVLAAALAAAYAGCRVGHVEAGLRTYDRRNPFPEELNRVLVDHASDLHFAPTERARQALLREGIREASIHVTGNTVIDALQVMLARRHPATEPFVKDGRRLILVTAHRRENHGRPIREISEALKQLAMRDDVHIVYPVHRNPNIWQPVHQGLDGIGNVTLLEPLDDLDFIHWMKRAYLILTERKRPVWACRCWCCAKPPNDQRPWKPASHGWSARAPKPSWLRPPGFWMTRPITQRWRSGPISSVTARPRNASLLS